MNKVRVPKKTSRRSSKRLSKRLSKKSSKRLSKKKSKKKSKKSSKRTSKRHTSKKSSKGGVIKHPRDENYHEVIIDFLKTFDKTLKEKKIDSFFVFPENKPFTKIKKSKKEIKKILKSNIDKYKNRQIAEISFCLMHEPEEDEEVDKDDTILNRLGIYLTTRVYIFNIDEDGNLQGKKNPGWATTISWKQEDFKISKPSLKLAETIMNLTKNETISTLGSFGWPLTGLIKELQIEKINIDDVLKPL